MDPTSRDSWRTYGNGIAAGGESIQLIYPPSATKADDAPLHTDTQLSEPVIAFGSPHSGETLDDQLDQAPARNASKPASPPQQGNNAPNNSALAGVGSGGRGSAGPSTPNAGGGGGGASGGGGGGGGANWNQLLNNYGNLAGNAPMPATTPAIQFTAGNAAPSVPGTTSSAVASPVPTTPASGTLSNAAPAADAVANSIGGSSLAGMGTATSGTSGLSITQTSGGVSPSSDLGASLTGKVTGSMTGNLGNTSSSVTLNGTFSGAFSGSFSASTGTSSGHDGTLNVSGTIDGVTFSGTGHYCYGYNPDNTFYGYFRFGGITTDGRIVSCDRGLISGSLDSNYDILTGSFNGPVTVTGLPPKTVPDPTNNCNCGCPGQSGDLVQTSAALTGTSVSQSSAAPVRYADGVVTVAETDLHSDGFGFPWGQTRSWTNGPGYAYRGDNGNGWVDTYTPHLIQADGSTNNTLIVLANGTTAYYFNLVNGSYQSSLDDNSQLSYDSSSDTYTLIDGQGDQIVFTGFNYTRPPGQLGELASYTDAAGVKIAVTSYTSDGHIAEMQRSAVVNGQTTTESWLYSYVSSGANTGLLSNVTLRTQVVNGGAWSTVQQVAYTYYDGTQQYGGNVGDLMTATVEDGSGNVLSTNYYRYYTPGQANGYTGGLEYVFNNDSYNRLTAALGTNLGSLTDAQVAPYADNYFQYDSSQRAILETVQGGDSQTGGGLSTSTYSYTASSNPAGYNSWAAKTVVTNPDGSTDTEYTSAYGEVMLDDHYDPASGLHTINFYAYNDQGQLVLQAAPSAVKGYDDTYADLLNNQSGTYQYLNNSSGLITRYDYYTTTTATETTAGGVAGYQQDEQIQQGQQGTLIPQEMWQYYAHSANGQTIAPVATDTVYGDTGGGDPRMTAYVYTWFANSAQMESETVSAPVVSATQNGPAAADVTTTFFDQQGNTIWVKDPDGYIQYYAYDPVTDAQVTSIQDVNTADTGEFTNLPSGWTTPTGGGLNLVTTDQVDSQGRTIEETSPNGNITYYVYLDSQQEERIYRGWNASTGMPTGPTEVIRQDAANGYTETLTMTATPNLTNGVPDGTEAISGLQTLTRDYTNDAGQVVAEDSYFNLSGLTYTTAVMGALGVNYYQTQYGYDNRGRQSRTQTANGTIYRTVYDSLGRPISDWVGTNDTPTSGEWSPTNNDGTSNMVEVRSYQYDIDSNLTQETDYPRLGAASQVTDNYYDWRDRLVATKSGVGGSENDGVGRPITVTTYDNLNEAIETQQYDGDGVTPQIVNGVLQALDPSLLRAQEMDRYDDQGRLYQTQVFDVNPSTGAVSTSALTTNYYFDHRGNQIAESAPGGLWTKSQFDGAGRDVMDSTTDGLGGTTWAAASSVAGDTVLEQTQTVYDGDGNAIETIDRQRFDDATGTGSLGSPTSGIGARVYYAASYYDNADRLIADVDAGTNGGTAWTRPDSVPASSSTLLVSNYVYNPAGYVQDTIDPQGIDDRTLYDNLGRTTETIQDYTDGVETADSNIATEYGYDGDNNTLYVQADEPGGSYQRTAYVYGVTTAGGIGNSSGVNSNDILSAVQYPDPTTGDPSSSQQESYLVNALGQNVQYTDRNGSVHQYTYDVLGRITADAVTTLGAGVDGSVRRIEYAYDSQGNQSLITSYDAASGGTIVNQVLRQYNGLGQLTAEYQGHHGAVDTSATGTLQTSVRYTYNEMDNGENNSRLTSIIYPSTYSSFLYTVSYHYDTGLDDRISRLSSLSDNSPLSNGYLLESYKYLGVGTVVERDHPQTNINQTYISPTGQTGDAGDQYVGLGRFGRVVNDNWVNATTGQSTDDFAYGYNPDGDVLYKQNLVDAAMSELYQYNNLHELISFQRGTLNATHDGIVGTPSASQSWSPDALGNFNSVTTDGTTQTRTANQQNEITSISGAGAVTYDANGNLTADGSGNSYVYDAWNHLVAVNNGGTTVASYNYDGLGRQITQTQGSNVRELYYSSQGQVLAEWYNGLVQAYNVWSPVYVNALVVRDQARSDNGTLNDCFYAQQDANWNVTALVSTAGTVVERYDYTPFGVQTVLNPADFSVRGSSLYAVPYGFQGMRTDLLVGLQFAENGRVYSPTLMRWLQTDPIGLKAGNNDYEFAGNSPTNATDPSGEDFIAVADRRVGGTAGLYHYSLEYWKTKCNGPNKEILIAKWLKDNKAEKVGSIELLSLQGKYKTWRWHNGMKKWIVDFVNISVIHYNDDTGVNFKSIYDAKPDAVKEKWDFMLKVAKAYPFAEQEGFDGKFQHWPNSVYVTSSTATNSNTFVRFVVSESKLTMVKLGGSHPGAQKPMKQNPEFWPVTPWPKDATKHPPRPERKP